MAPAPTTLTVAVTPDPVSQGANFTVSGNLSVSATGAPIAGATIHITVGSLSANPVTDQSGNYFVTFTTAPSSGSYTVTASWPGNLSYAAATGTTTLTTVLPTVATTLSIALNPTSISEGGTYTVSGTLIRDDTGVGVPGETITISVDGVTVTTTATDQSGNYSVALTAPNVPGSHTVKSVFAGATYGYLSLLRSQASTTFGTPTLGQVAPVIAVLAIAGIGIGAAVYYSRRRR